MKKEINFLGDVRTGVLTLLLLFLGAWSSTAWADGETNPGTITRSDAVGTYGTICLPYDATTFSGISILSMVSISNSKIAVKTATQPTTLQAGHPYLYKATEGTQTFTCTGTTYIEPASYNGFTGTYTEATPSGTFYYLNNGTSFDKNASGTTVAAYTCYITQSGLSSDTYQISLEETSTITLSTTTTGGYDETNNTHKAAQGEIITLTATASTGFIQYEYSTDSGTNWENIGDKTVNNSVTFQVNTQPSQTAYKFRAILYAGNATDGYQVPTLATSEEISVTSYPYSIKHREHNSTDTGDYTTANFTYTETTGNTVTLNFTDYNHEEDILLHNGATGYDMTMDYSSTTSGAIRAQVTQPNWTTDIALVNKTDNNYAIDWMCGVTGGYTLTLSFDVNGTVAAGLPKLNFGYPAVNKIRIYSDADKKTCIVDSLIRPQTVSGTTYNVAGPFNLTYVDEDTEFPIDVYWNGQWYSSTAKTILTTTQHSASGFTYSSRKKTFVDPAPFNITKACYYIKFDGSDIEVIYPTCMTIGESTVLPLEYQTTGTYAGKYTVTQTLNQGTMCSGSKFYYDGISYGVQATVAYEKDNLELNTSTYDATSTIKPWVTGNYTLAFNPVANYGGSHSVSVHCTKPETYTRNVSTNAYGTICLPYAVSSYTGISKLYSVKSYSSTDKKIYLQEETTMTAGNPYIFQAGNVTSISVTFNNTTAASPTAAATVNGFTGVYPNTDGTTMSAPTGMYILQNTTFKKVASTNLTIGGFRGYLNLSDVSTSSAKSDIGFTIFDDSTTDIESVEALNDLMNGNAVIYDLSGRRLNSLQKGINIVNGKKIIVK